jgi:hypothetical protein
MATNDVKIRVGLRRLYRAHGCEIETGNLEKDFLLGENFSASVRIGSHPQFGLHTGGFNCRYLTPGIDKLEVNYRYEPDIEKTELAGQPLTEIIVSREIDVEEEFRDAFEIGETAFQNKAADLAYAETTHLVPTLEFVGGLIGLRIARQFLAELVNETPVTWRNDGPHLQFLYKGPTILGGIQLTSGGGDYLRAYLESLTGNSLRT